MFLEKGVVLVDMSERTTTQTIAQVIQLLFVKEATSRVITARFLRLRAIMHLYTIFNFCYPHLLTAFPATINKIVTFLVKPDLPRPYGMNIVQENKNFTEIISWMLGLRSLRVVETGRCVGTRECEQWNDGNNVFV